jgi:SAM-dependent methyltransferase
MLGALIIAWQGYPEHYRWLEWAGAGRSSRILDVGCGGGGLLQSLYRDGFSHLRGIDPFLPPTGASSDDGRLVLRRSALPESAERFDLILMNHSLEHVPEPETTLIALSRCLADEGKILIRTPILPNYCWEIYGPSWVQLDAPRHCFIFTRKALELLASHAGLRIERWGWDSTQFQFIGSEQYRRDIPLMSDRSHIKSPRNSIFTKEELRRFRSNARQLNEEGRGDQVFVVLAKALPSVPPEKPYARASAR